MSTRQLYIVMLKQGLVQKRLFLEGNDTDEARSRLRSVMERLPGLALVHPDWLEYLSRATQELEEAGFLRVAH